MNFLKKIFLVIITLSIVTSLLFTLTGCPSEAQVEEAEETTTEETTPEETTPEETAEETAEETGEETTEEVLTAPTIRLEIYEGPTFSPHGDNVCYYRVKAHVTGNPYPAISFNKDDSLGTWGKNVSQVNLYKKGDSFTLEATATNSQGTASDSITLTYSCIPTIPILIVNNTGGTLYIDLDGPAKYSFKLPPGNQTINVIPGEYSYTVVGCGGVKMSGKDNLSKQLQDWTWWCE